MRKKLRLKVLPIVLSLCVFSSILDGCGKDFSQETVSTTETVDEVNTELLETKPDVDKKMFEKAGEDAKKADKLVKKTEAEVNKAEGEEKAKEERIKAEAEAKKAEEERIKAEAETKRAEAEAKKAEEERLKAEAEARKAEEERLMAEIEEENTLSATQLTSINMLNYMTVLTQEINTSKGNQLFLETARTSLYNDTNLNAVDTKTQAQIKQLVEIIDEYRMVDVKKERLQFIYEQNRAQALRQAIPNPMGLLSTVQSGSKLKVALSAIYMAVDSATSYQASTNQAEIQFVKEGWELDDTEIKVLQNSTTAQFDYMCNMVRDYDIPDEYVVRDTDVKAFVEWSNKTNLVAKIDWLKANEATYQKFGPYWLELVKDYYDFGDYRSCMTAICQYEEISEKITRKDADYASALPMVIIAAKETMPKDEYVKTARRYCSAIVDNTKDEDWALRYFVTQIYLDIYSKSKKNDDLKSAYDIAYYNVNTLVDKQRELNNRFLSPIQEVKVDKGATKRAKNEVKQYNRLLKEERKVAAPPVSEALYLNCELLFAIARERGITTTEKNRIEKLLYENEEALFLTNALDYKFRKDRDMSAASSKNIEIYFDGAELIIPATCISDRSCITASVNGGNKDEINDWEISEVKRPRNSVYSDFTVVLKSKRGKSHKYQVGEKIIITVVPIASSPDDAITFSYEVIPIKKALVFNGIAFERK